MAKVIKLKDRQGSVVLPLTRSQLVQVSQITGLDLLNNKTFTSASVQDALEALMAYATTIKESNAGALTDIATIKDALKDVLNNQRAVANYVDSAKNLSYAKAESEAAAAQANSYAWAETKATAAENAAKEYADGKFLTQVKLNDGFINVQTNENGRFVDLGSIATSDSLQTLTNKVNAIEAAYITKTASEEADTAIVTAYENADAAIITGYTQADTAIISSYTAADSAIITAYQAADAALTSEINALKSSYTVSLTEAAGSGDVLKVYTISQGGNSIGTINIPKDLVAVSGEIVYKDGNDNDGTFIKLTIQNGNPFYIDVASLIEYNSVDSTAEVTLSQDANHKITATIGKIAASKIDYTTGENGETVAQALSRIDTALGAGGSVASQIQTEIEKLDSSVTATGTPAKSGVMVLTKVDEVDGKLNQSGSESVEVEAAGAAAAVKTELLGNANTDNNTLGKLAARIDTLNGAAVKKVNNQTPNANGEVTVNASQIDTVNTYKIGSDQSATTHTVDEVLAAGVYFEEATGFTNIDDVSL